MAFMTKLVSITQHEAELENPGNGLFENALRKTNVLPSLHRGTGVCKDPNAKQ